jgi:hypothetical protein
VSDVEAAARAHAGRVVAADPAARADLAPGSAVDPPDLLDRLLGGRFSGFELVAHARIGAHHVLKTRYAGPTTMVVQARWVQDADADRRWRIHEAEIARVAPGESA